MEASLASEEQALAAWEAASGEAGAATERVADRETLQRLAGQFARVASRGEFNAEVRKAQFSNFLYDTIDFNRCTGCRRRHEAGEWRR